MIRLSKSCLSENEKKAVARVLDDEFLGMGKQVEEFEQMLSSFFDRPAVCVINGTAALHLALQCIDVGRDDEVLVPSLTYLASFQAISSTGATAIPCDISENDFLLDPIDLEKKISNRTKAIMPVHYTGGSSNLNQVYNIAKKYNLRVVEDAAHAFGSVHKDKLIGSFGDISCFSFDGIKNITSGEGGCITSSDEKVINRIKDARLLGVKKDTEKRYKNERSWFFDVDEIGWRYHMSNIMAAIGIEQLKRFNELSAKRKLLAKQYDEHLSKFNDIITLSRNYNDVVPHIYVIRIPGLNDRNLLQKLLLDKGIQIGFHYFPNHLLTFFKNENFGNLPVTEKVYNELVTLPLHPDLKNDDINYITSELRKVLNEILYKSR